VYYFIGTNQERGIAVNKSKKTSELEDPELQKSVGVTYDLPYGMGIIRK